MDIDYPEVFEGKTYKVTIDNVIFADVDGDGIEEAIVHYKTNYLQSPTIVIYHIGKKLNVSRVMEGFAPGALVKRGNYYLDSHTLGLAVDVSTTDANAEDMALSSLKSKFGNAVVYKTFIHMDMREKKTTPTYMDLTYLNVPNGDRTCRNFEFHSVNEIYFGKVGNSRMLAAWVGPEIYFYQIRKFNKKWTN